MTSGASTHTRRKERNQLLGWAMSIVFLLLDLVFGDAASGQPVLQLIACEFISALGTSQLALGNLQLVR